MDDSIVAVFFWFRQSPRARRSKPDIATMPKFFKDVPSIKFEGAKSRNPLAFKHYRADERVEGKAMREHLRFSVVYWHTFRGLGSDPFGVGTAIRPWDDGTSSVRNA